MMDTVLLFDADDGGAGAMAVQTADTGIAATPPANDAAAPEGSGGAQNERIAMTPAQLSDRLERARGAERAALVKSLGFDSLEALQDAIRAGTQALEAQKTEAERQAEALRQATERLQQLETVAQNAQAERERLLIRSAAVEKMAGRFIDPGAAYRLLDLSRVVVDGEKVNGLDDAIEALAKQYPWTLVSARKEIAPRIGATNPDGTPVQTKESDAEKRARYFGGGGNSGFFSGGGVKPVSEKKPK